MHEIYFSRASSAVKDKGNFSSKSHEILLVVHCFYSLYTCSLKSRPKSKQPNDKPDQWHDAHQALRL